MCHKIEILILNVNSTVVCYAFRFINSTNFYCNAVLTFLKSVCTFLTSSCKLKTKNTVVIFVIMEN